MSAISTTTLLGGLVDLNVFDDEVTRIEALSVGIGFGVLEKVEEVFGGFLGPAGFGHAELFAYVFSKLNCVITWVSLIFCEVVCRSWDIQAVLPNKRKFYLERFAQCFLHIVSWARLPSCP